MCVFCSVVNREVDAEIVYEDDHVVGFLDHRPLFPGHTLVVPRAHHETLRDLPSELIAPFFDVVQRLAAAVQDALGSEGTFVALNNVVSQSVPHLHTHVVPRNRKDGLRGFFWPRTGYDDDEHRRRIADAIRALIEQR